MFELYKDTLTVSEVCKALSIGKNKAYDLLKNGTINSIKCGKKYIVPKIYLIDYIYAQRKKGNKSDGSA